MNKYRLREEDAEALKIEIEILREIHHSNLVEMYDVFNSPTDDYCYIVTEKIVGGSLYDRIKAKGRYGEDEGRLASRTMFDAITYAHKHDIGKHYSRAPQQNQGVFFSPPFASQLLPTSAHRDLKLENLLLMVSGSCYLVYCF